MNRKGGIEVASHIPGEWHRLEPKLVERIKKHFQRGKFSLGVRFNFHDSSCGVYWNPEAVGQAVKQLRGLAEAQGVELELNGEVLLNLVKMIDTSSALPDALEVEDMVITALDTSIEQLKQMRETEGAALKQDVMDRLIVLEQLNQEVKAESANTVQNHQETLMCRLKKLNLELDMDDERFLREITFFVDRCDISEELTRIDSHLKQFYEMLEQPGAVGRKLDFLCQELHREINTIGSKANNIEITRRVIDLKNELERIREQIQNLE